MPFVDRAHREKPDLEIPGDRCFVHFKAMMAAWRDSPRWTTADDIASHLFPDEMKRAEFLAFLVFFNNIVMPYERDKEACNGSI